MNFKVRETSIYKVVLHTTPNKFLSIVIIYGINMNKKGIVPIDLGDNEEAKGNAQSQPS